MPIKLLGLNFSPRDDGNSEALLKESLAKAAEKHPGELEYEAVDLKDTHVEHCRYCDLCGKDKETGEFLDCILRDQDEVQEVLDKMLSSDGIVVATPVYFGLPSDLFSRFIQRTRVLRHQDFALANRPVGVMAVAGRRSGGGETTILATWMPFIRNGCLVVGNGDATCQYGAIGWAGPRRQILTDEWGMEQGLQVVERVFDVARLIQAGSKALDFRNTMKFCYSSGMRP